MLTGMTVAMINELKDMSMKDREKLAGILMSEGGNFIDSLFSCVSEDEKIRKQEIQKQAEELKKYPAAVWAAQALDQMEVLTCRLDQILTEARDGNIESGENFTMFLEAVSSISEKMLKITTDHDPADVMRILAYDVKNEDV